MNPGTVPSATRPDTGGNGGDTPTPRRQGVGPSMCGRFDLSESGRTLRIGDFELELTTSSPRYNIAPLQSAPVVRWHEGVPIAADFRWGLIPSWSKDASFAARCINARSETVATKPMFRSAFAKRRCLVPADGYFEWQKVASSKLPWRFVRRDRQPLLFAGLWETWRPPSSETGLPAELRTFTVLTTAANADTRDVHDRMPVILDPSSAAAWLNPTACLDPLLDLCRTPEAGLLDRYRVSTVVNNSRNDTPECVRRWGDGGTGEEGRGKRDGR